MPVTVESIRINCHYFEDLPTALLIIADALWKVTIMNCGKGRRFMVKASWDAAVDRNISRIMYTSDAESRVDELLGLDKLTFGDAFRQ